MGEAGEERVVERAAEPAALLIGIDRELDEFEVAVQPFIREFLRDSFSHVVRPPLPAAAGVAVREADDLLVLAGDDAAETLTLCVPFGSCSSRKRATDDSSSSYGATVKAAR